MRKKLVMAVALGVAAVMTASCSGTRTQAQNPSTVHAQARPSPDTPTNTPTSPPAEKVTAPATVDGLVPVVRKIQTDKPYVFITIDDGAVKDPAALQLIRDSGAKPTLFLNSKYFKGSEEYFKSLQGTGIEINNHTMTHPNLKGKPYELQHQEICGDSDAIQQAFGKRPTLFRPPFGNYDDNTRKAVAACGMKAIVLWTAAVNDGVVQFQAGSKLKPGDIVLMHFRHTFSADYQAFVDRAEQDGLTPVPLWDFLA
ncbi:polysaccharide deacetylase family protein [Kibdelosporangium phytohabitans]|uniref:Chitooligosaccharide deacetylase n=1 Tax=Kibdelosporangium phytohabitans TaxID=860235 RepID=A0A0N7F4J5_9PSEU|nr:polysaccharide deacetylase family protein [Kibdelosporangium phytohabitans]ALG11607.1 chitooligosaccharide deacetylase [Kibdelosporangium phytohabitans]MBE1462980.1 peptidoglycan/xylan/chitin deacetylase (PgdA/CDA1 family) [Kibdelosporangium phytohabitans]